MNNHKRIAGSIIGETSFGRLIYLMTNYDTIYKAGKEAFSVGDNRKVDMLVEDIYGDDLKSLGLFQILIYQIYLIFGKLIKACQKEF